MSVSAQPFDKLPKERLLMADPSQKNPPEVELQIAKLVAKTMAHSDLLAAILQKIGFAPLEALEIVVSAEKKREQSFLEYIEDADPSLAAQIDKRDPENLIDLI